MLVSKLLTDGGLGYLCALLQAEHINNTFLHNLFQIVENAKTLLRAELGIFQRQGNRSIAIYFFRNNALSVGCLMVLRIYLQYGLPNMSIYN